MNNMKMVWFLKREEREGKIKRYKTNTMIQLSNIDKYYDSRFQRTFVLKAVNLEVKEGEFVSIMGPSGSGKSTLLNIIGLLDAPSAGEYSLYDKSVLDLKEKAKVEYHRNFMGFIFQAYHLIEEMTVYENIETPLIYKGVKSDRCRTRFSTCPNFAGLMS
jgi:ABC-type lipoprotein export system ATPase subunit